MTPGAAYILAVGFLAAVNVAGNLWLPSWSYLPVNLAAVILLLGIGRRGGAGPEELGLRRDRLGRGLAAGILVALAVAAVIALAAAIPATRGFFEDERAGGVAVGGLMYQVLLRIPLGTALFEEVAFRGVLLGLGLRLWSTTRAVWVSSLLFGLWHVLPALSVADQNDAVTGAPPALVMAGAVATTVVAGLMFAVVRLRARHLVAVVLMHAATNSLAFTAAWLVLRSN